MSASHHGSDDQRRLQQLFDAQRAGMAPRRWPNGRCSADDDGELAFRMGADPKRQLIAIEFSKPTDWVAFDLATAEWIRDQLTERMLELRGITP